MGPGEVLDVANLKISLRRCDLYLKTNVAYIIFVILRAISTPSTLPFI
jgi:hypothetical protein